MKSRDSDEMSISPRHETSKRSRSRSPRASFHEKTSGFSSSSSDMFAKTPEAAKENLQIRLGGETEDAKGYYVPQVGEVLIDSNNGLRFRIASIKGKGVFSCVVEVQDMDSNAKLAIKVLRNNEIMLKSGEKEAKILQKLNSSDPLDRRHIIRCFGSFPYQGHLCIKFELLGTSLRDLLSKGGFSSGLSLEAVRSFARQGFIALYHLKLQKIIHSDSKFYIVKPDNILISQDFRKIKLSDFGTALEEGENKITENLVARYYRPPEIFLGYPYDHSLDVWSMACSLFEIFTGNVLFPGISDSHMIKLMMELKGIVPKKMRTLGKFAGKFFEEFQFVYVKNELEGMCRVPLGEIKKEKNLGVVLEPGMIKAQGNDGVEAEEYRKEVRMFQNFLEQCLEIDPNERITPELALKHPFIVKKSNSL